MFFKRLHNNNFLSKHLYDVLLQAADIALEPRLNLNLLDL